MSKHIRRKQKKRRPIILIDTERLSIWGFFVGLVATAVDIAVLLVLVYWLHVDMALKLPR